MTLEGKWRPHRSRVRRLADPWGASSTAPGLARAERPAAAPRLRLTPPPAQGSRSPLEKRMLLAALRSSPPKLVCSQSLRGHTPHVSRQYCWRSASVKGSSGKRSVTLLLENVKLISVQAW